MDERNRKEERLDTKRAVFKYVKNYHRNKENRLVLEGSNGGHCKKATVSLIILECSL